MNSLMKKIGLAVALGATTLVAAAPAEAQRWRGGYGGYGGGFRNFDRNNGGTAIIAGIAGLAIGAAILSNRNDRFRDDFYRQGGFDPYYDDTYYRSHNFYPNDGYYADQWRGNFNRCFVERRYDPYYDQVVRVRVCR